MTEQSVKKKSPAFLYIGGSYPQLAAIRSLRQIGLHVAVTDVDDDAPARTEVDFFARANATDVSQVLSVAENVAESHDLVGVYGVADYAFEAVFAVAQRLGLKGPACESVTLLTDKAETSRRLQMCGLPVPQLHFAGDEVGLDAELVSSLSGRDIVVKARSLNNSKAVHLLRRCEPIGLDKAVRKVSKMADTLMIEAYLPGQIGNVDGLMLAGKFYPISTTVRLDDPDCSAVCTAMIQPGGSSGHEQKCYELAEAAAKALGYETGPLTVDLVIDPGGMLHILEVSPHFHNIGCEIARGNGNPMAAYGSWLLGDPEWMRYMAEGVVKHGMLYQKFVQSCGVISDIEGFDELSDLPGVVDTRLVCGLGDRVKCNEEEKSLLCLVWATASGRDELSGMIDRIEHCVRAVTVST